MSISHRDTCTLIVPRSERRLAAQCKTFVYRWLLPLALCVAACTRSHQIVSAQGQFHYVGKSTCSSATCHGGVGGNGPAWNSSLRIWEATDVAHAGAGEVLFNALSRQLVAGLTSGRTESLSTEDLHRTLRDRCVSCHAPAAYTNSVETQLADVEFESKVSQGVSCEGCHGPASVWLERHVDSAWRDHWLKLTEPTQANEPVSREVDGMRATHNWLARTDNCIRCHVGSRTADGMIRDMNHDLIAAGHPALRFDMSLYQAALPTHWENQWVDRAGGNQLADEANRRVTSNMTHLRISKQASGGPSNLSFEIPSLQQHHAARLRTLAAVAKLAHERLEANLVGAAPYPEFAEFNCFDCHHAISLDRQLSTQQSFEHVRIQASWNGWYLAGELLDWQAAELRPASFTIARPPQMDELERLRSLAAKQANTQMQRDALDSMQDLRLAGNAMKKEGPVDNWNREAIWYWTNRLALQNSQEAQQLDAQQFEAMRSQLFDLLLAFEQAMEFGNSGGVTHNGPEQVNFRKLGALRAEYLRIVNSQPDASSVGGEQR